jgi:replicative DNA helicase
MLDKAAIDAVAGLRGEDFYSEANRQIFEAAQWLSANGKPIDIVTVGARLRDTDRLASMGGAPYLAQLVDTVPSVANVETYAELIRDKSVKRQVIAASQRTAIEGYDFGGSAAEYADRAEQAIYDISRAPKGSGLEHVDPIQRRVFQRIVDTAQRGERIIGTPTGFERYDAKTAGLHDGELTSVAARPGVGKTSFVMNVAVNVASPRTEATGAYAEQTIEVPGVGVAVFSLEMDREALMTRLLCSEARVDSGKMRQGFLQDRDWSNLTEASKHIVTLPIWIDDTASPTPLEIRAKVRRLQAEIERSGGLNGKRCDRVGLVVIDYLQLATATGQNIQSRQQEVGSITRALKRMAKELHVPVIALSQLNRAVEMRGGPKGKRPQLSDLREAGDIEQDCDNIIFIHRDDYYDDEAETKGIAELIIAKQRNGPTGKVKVRWTSAFTRFDNLAPGEFDQEEDAA